jgi:glycosyltransferase involved in cell wall biosynthesis
VDNGAQAAGGLPTAEEAGREPEFDVSIVIPAYNRVNLIGDAIAGVYEQSSRVATEVIVVDDCSTDGTADVAARLGATVLRHESNQGAGAARKTGTEAARGRWIAFLDSDDRWAPDHLRIVWGARNGHVLVSTSGVGQGRTGFYALGSPFLRPVVLRSPRDVMRPENLIPTGAAIVRADALRSAGGSSEDRFAEDLDVWLRVLEQGTGVVLPDITVAYRRHEGQASSDGVRMRAALLDVLDRFEGRPWCDSRLHRSVAVTVAWDSVRARGGSPLPAVAAAVRAGSLVDLLLLLSRRARRRQRWKLQRSRCLSMLNAIDQSRP